MLCRARTHQTSKLGRVLQLAKEQQQHQQQQQLRLSRYWWARPLKWDLLQPCVVASQNSLRLDQSTIV